MYPKITILNKRNKNYGYNIRIENIKIYNDKEYCEIDEESYNQKMKEIEDLLDEMTIRPKREQIRVPEEIKKIKWGFFKKTNIFKRSNTL